MRAASIRPQLARPRVLRGYVVAAPRSRPRVIAVGMETELSSVEGQRVMQVLDETLNATRLISCVTPDLRSRSANITDVAGPEVTDLLLAHVDLLEEYEGALAKCGGEPKSNDMVDVTLRLQDSVRTLSRLPGRYPGLVDKLMVMAMDTDMQRVVTRGVHTLEGLKHITFQKLITSVEEENSRQNFISGIERKEQQKQKERKDLETRLTAEKESRQKEVKRLTDQRDKLQGAGPPQPTTQAWCCRCLTLAAGVARRRDRGDQHDECGGGCKAGERHEGAGGAAHEGAQRSGGEFVEGVREAPHRASRDGRKQHDVRLLLHTACWARAQLTSRRVRAQGRGRPEGEEGFVLLASHQVH